MLATGLVCWTFCCVSRSFFFRGRVFDHSIRHSKGWWALDTSFWLQILVPTSVFVGRVEVCAMCCVYTACFSILTGGWTRPFFCLLLVWCCVLVFSHGKFFLLWPVFLLSWLLKHTTQLLVMLVMAGTKWTWGLCCSEVSVSAGGVVSRSVAFGHVARAGW